MIRYDPYSCLKFKKRVQISTTEYCNKVTYNHMRPFLSTVGGNCPPEYASDSQYARVLNIPEF